jgi:2-dehydro-3-deoxy-D-arabinonate dehydratase
MNLTKHLTASGPRWALDGFLLPAAFRLGMLMELPNSAGAAFLKSVAVGERVAANAPLIAPIESTQEVWACGVTYLRSRDARKEESSVKDVYQKVYEAERPEIFYKAHGWRVQGHGAPIRIRDDSAWNVPEPELTLVVNAHGEIIGYCVGNDVSSRDIEGENPLYLPQAKVYNGSCALGPGIVLCDADELHTLAVQMQIARSGKRVFEGETNTNQMKRKPAELVQYLFKELAFPSGAFVLTGTGIVPGSDFSLTHGDVVTITVGELTLENKVA